MALASTAIASTLGRCKVFKLGIRFVFCHGGGPPLVRNDHLSEDRRACQTSGRVDFGLTSSHRVRWEKITIIDDCDFPRPYSKGHNICVKNPFHLLVFGTWTFPSPSLFQRKAS